MEKNDCANADNWIRRGEINQIYKEFTRKTGKRSFNIF